MQATQVRIDKWLWAARFFKTRGLATENVHAGHVRLNEHTTKASKPVHIGDVLHIKRGEESFVVLVLALAEKRGSATMAQKLYEETSESTAARAVDVAQRRLQAASRPEKRPDKKARRQIIQFISKK
ncbi:MAG: S4 domain-containing protein [Mariprofundaceae bacterium]|nr:S4 domain-containing protein [Mariprofundaceae bacterium]